MAYGIKVPLTVVMAASNWIAPRVVGDRSRVKVAYDLTSFIGGSPGDPTVGSNRAALQSALACGVGSQGFVQYNGGFTWAHASCATVQVFNQAGHLIGSKRVAFGVSHCP